MDSVFNFSIPSFSKSFRGYTSSEVQSFLIDLEEFLGKVQENQVQNEQKIKDLEQELARLRGMEDSLFSALKMAEDAKNQWQARVEEEEKLRLDQAQAKALQILEKAEKDASKLKLLAENERKQLLDAAQESIVAGQRKFKEMQLAQAEIAQQLQELADLTLKKIEAWGIKPSATKKSGSIKKTNKAEELPTLQSVLQAYAKQGNDSGKIGDLS